MAQYNTNTEKLLDNLSTLIKRGRKEENGASRKGFGFMLDKIEDVTQIIPDESMTGADAQTILSDVFA